MILTLFAGTVLILLAAAVSAFRVLLRRRPVPKAVRTTIPITNAQAYEQILAELMRNLTIEQRRDARDLLLRHMLFLDRSVNQNEFEYGIHQPRDFERGFDINKPSVDQLTYEQIGLGELATAR